MKMPHFAVTAVWLVVLALTGFSCASARQESAAPAPAKTPRTKVALYVDDGSGGMGVFHWARLIGHSPKLELSLITGKEVREGGLKGKDLVVFPGGYSPRQYRSLKEEGAAAVRDFVAAGGSYLGICAGFASALNCKERIRLLPFGRKPQSGGKLAKLLVMITERGGKVLDIKPGKYLVRYNGGPIACPGEKPGEGWGEGLALFKNTVSYHNKPEGNFFDTPAIIHGQFGKGKVIATSFHPESYQSTHPIALGCIYAVTGVKPETVLPAEAPFSVKAGFCTSYVRPNQTNVDLMLALDRHPGITMKFIDGHEIDVGNLDVIDVLVLPEMGENSCKKFCESQKGPLQRFLTTRGGRVVGPESALQFLPGKARFKAAKTQADYVKYTLSRDW